MKYQDLEPYFGERVGVQFVAPVILFEYHRTINPDGNIEHLTEMYRKIQTPQGPSEVINSSPFVPVAVMRPVMQGDKPTGTGVTLQMVSSLGALLQMAIDPEIVFAVTRIVEKPRDNATSSIIKP
jgi:hypothetical protein